MKNKIVVASAAILLIGVVAPASSFAEEVDTVTENVTIEDTSITETVSEPEPTYDPGMSPGEHGAWVPVDANGNAFADVIVCTPEVCGESGPGSFAELAFGEGTKMILQTLQDPVEAANSDNGVGNVAGYNNATYNSNESRWEIHEVPEDYGPNRVYEIPLAYPGSEEGKLICLENCPEEPIDSGTSVSTDSTTTSTDIISVATQEQETVSEEIVAKQGQYFVSRIINNTKIEYLIVKPKIKKNKFFFWYNAGTKRLHKNVTAIFENNENKVSKSFKIRKDGRVKIHANNSFLDDEIIIKNNDKVLERIILVR